MTEAPESECGQAPEPQPAQPHDIQAARDAYNAGGDINITNNYNYLDSRETLASALQDEADLAKLVELHDLERFTGRRQLIAEIEGFIATHSRGWVVVEGGSGVGKSALATQLARNNGWFFHSTSFTGGESPESVRKNLAAQLIRKFGLDELAPDGKFPAIGADAAYLARALKAAAAARGKGAPEGLPIVLVIDSLNEITSAGQSDNPVALPAARELPHKVFVVATRRPAPEPLSLGSPLLLSTIETGEADGRNAGDGRRADKHPGDSNTQDMREYMRDLFDGPKPDQALVKKLRSYDMAPTVFTETLVARCAGVWIYLKYVLDDVRTGDRPPTDVISLPRDLRIYYLEQIRRQQEPDRDKWQRFRRPALATLAALRRPVTWEELASLAGIDDDGDMDKLWDWLDRDIRPLLHIDEDPASGETTYQIRHQSLRDLMADPKTKDRLGSELRQARRQAHAKITAHLIPEGPQGQRDWANADPYVREALAEHAAIAGRLDELVLDPGFLLICQPSSVLLRRRYLTEPESIAAVGAYEEALNEWAEQPFDDSERVWRLHVWARKTGAQALAVACGRMAGRTPLIQAAMWTGTTRRAIHAHAGSVATVTTVPMRDRPAILASGGSDGLVRLWDPVTATPIGEPLSGHDDGVMAAAAVPLPDQRILLATGDREGTVRLWNPAGRTPVGNPIAAHRGPVDAIAVATPADDRTMLVTCGRDGTVRLWDPHTGKRLGQLAAHGEWIMAAAAVPLGGQQLLATGGKDGTVWLWDLTTMLPVGEPMTGHVGAVNVIAVAALSDDRAVLATAGADGTVWLWDPKARAPIAARMTGHAGPVTAITVAWLADRPLFVTAGQDRTVRLWDPAVGEAAPLSLNVGARWVSAVAALPLPDGRTLLATGGSDGKVELQELYESATGTPATAPSSGHTGPVNTIAVARHANRTVFVSGSRDRTVRLWDPETGAPVGDPLTGHGRPLTAVAAVPLPDGQNLIAASDADGAVRLWDVMTSPPTSRPLRSYAKVYAIAPVELPDRTLLATGGSDRTVRLWDPVSGKPAGVPLTGHAKPVNTIAAVRLPDGHTVLATGGSDGTVRFWDPAAGVAVGDPLTGYGEKIHAVAAVRLPDGRVLFAAGGEYGKVYVWSGTTRIAVLEPPPRQTAPVNAIAAVELPDRTLLATGGNDRMIRLWDPVTGEPVGDALAGHSGAVNAIASVRLPGGPTLLATGGDDKTILIWTFG